ncbi:MAG: 4-hydroxybenzoyl-CoA thioesterase family active site [uncultured Sulfurovum sp.]|uniref:4-hydroxybenzoyl-CoA thioesterase family active site n=1 Tax=uncultured Sulfurovum sp. TaxID=269237 RepID=A0A6S6SV59_9BACT|nr:MAG: 4-hydroxybenzoyl-CoA thioesterase family active site [uncultured Sulfurovum sp.]
MLIRIYYEDTDAGGIVYHTNYIKYCERARSELFFSRNLSPTDGENSGFVVRHIDSHFLGMSRLGDTVEVCTTLVKKKNSSIILKQSISNDGKEVFVMDITLVFVRDGKPHLIPEKFSEILC